jgi:hypothetical protein
MFWRKQKSSTSEPAWSDDPGRFELHLVRRLNNPLFPPARRKVTHQELAEAQRRDARDLAQLQQDVTGFLAAEAARTDWVHEYHVVLSNRFKRALELLEMAAAIGGPCRVEETALEAIVTSSRDALFEYFGENEQPKSQLRTFEALSRMAGFLAQFGADGPMLKEFQEDFRSALCADDESLSAHATIMAGLGARAFLENARKILSEAVRDGYPVVDARRKLGIIEAAFEAQQPVEPAVGP